MTDDIGPVPLVLVTGFLGSGKTTLLNALLRHPDMAGTAVLMNEIGSVGIDHSLVVGASDDILLLEGGCLCCQPKGSIGDGVSRLLALQPAPKRIVIETSGAANPFPILETLSQHPQATSGFRFPRVVTVVDSVFGGATLARHAEARFQLSAADIVVLGKGDIADPEDKAAVQRWVAETSPAAVCLDRTGDGTIDELVALLHKPMDLALARAEPGEPHRGDAHHDTEFETVGLQFDGRLDAETVQAWIDEVLGLYGGNILRIKGILNLDGYSRPAVLQCVRDIVHPIELLDANAATVHRNSIVAIGWDMHPELIREALRELAGQARQPLDDVGDVRLRDGV